MSTQGIVMTPGGIASAHVFGQAASFARRILQGVGGLTLLAGAAAIPWTEFASTGITVGMVPLHPALILLTACVVLTGLACFAASVWGLVRRLQTRTLAGVLAIVLVTLASIAGAEYGYLRTGGVSAYEYRDAARLVLYTLGIALLACSVPEELGPRLALAIRRQTPGFKTVALLSALVVLAGSLVGWLVLDGMPHITDGTAYLLEARTLWSGQLALDPPLYPELFESELLAFRLTEAGYFGKYPIGWPLVLGAFDAVGAPWLANAVLAGVMVLLTYAVVAEHGGKRLAGLSAAAAAVCPWLWFNAGTLMSHLASAVWLWLFLWLFLRGMRTQRHLPLLGAGLALGAAVLTRPADAAFFALPCVVVALVTLARRPRAMWTRLHLVVIGALPGTLAYLWTSQHLSGGGSTYGGAHTSALFHQTPHSLAHGLAWLHESWVGLSSQWLAGAAPAGVFMVCGLVFGRARLRGQGLVLACGASVFLCYSVFVFGGRAWVGPRWYVPLIPVGALLIAAGIDAAAQAARVRSAGGVLATGYLRASAVAVAVMLCVAVPARLVEWTQRPPHGIDGGVVQVVEQANLQQAVVALPISGLDPATGQPNYKRGIAGMWTMQAPFERSGVIYIAAVPGWEQMAHDSWPNRALYSMNHATRDYTLTPVQPPMPSDEAQP